jgi:hypothetical protein
MNMNHKGIKCFTFLFSNNIYTMHLKSTQTKFLRIIIKKNNLSRSIKTYSTGLDLLIIESMLKTPY